VIKSKDLILKIFFIAMALLLI